MTKVALYIRVSTEEQALHGYSIEAQKESLREYCKKNEYKVIGEYVDEGISARKKFNKRKGFLQLLNDVEAHKFDLILFTKLDRWFRNIADYYKIQEILERNNINWKTIYENYDTTTASGRLHINIMLSVAQDEADRTSERIKAVFKTKLAKGEAVTGLQPFGYKIENKKIVIDEPAAAIVKDIYNYYINSKSVHATYRYYKQQYEEDCCYNKISDMLRKKCYIGYYNEEYPDYYPAIISKTQWEMVQNMSKESFIRKNQTKRIYIFSGLIYCEECNHSMNGCCVQTTKQEYYAYRCRNAVSYYNCSHRHIIRETYIETYLLDNIEQCIYNEIAKAEIKTKQSKKKKGVDKEKIQKKLKKLKELFLNDFISLEEYKKDYEQYQSLLQETVEEKENIIDVAAYRGFLENNNKELYKNLSPERKQIFWRQIIKRIEVSNDNQIKKIYFY